MRAMIVTTLSVLIVAGCSHDGSKPTTEELKGQVAHAEADTTGGMTLSNQDMDCPMHVGGTTVRTEETTSGPALAFTTTGDVDELRMRVRRMAAAENRAQQHAQPKPKQSDARKSELPNMDSTGKYPASAAVPNMYSPDSHAAPGGSTGTRGDLMHESEGTPGEVVAPGTPPRAPLVRAESTESGARLVFVIEDAGQLESVRDRVQTSAQNLTAGRCPGMKKMERYQRPAAGGY